MFPVLFTVMTFKHVRVKTEGTFTAEDPWNQGRRTAFTIEAYVMAPKGSRPPRPAAKATIVPYFLGIRSEVDGVERMLPESLAYLWRNHRVPSEALPRLLKQMEPMLGKTDFRFQCLTKPYTISQYVFTALFALILLGWAAGVALLPEMGGSDSATILAIVTAFICGFLYLLFFRPKARRRRQMDWALSHL